jgi:hypothetical protein
MAFTEDERTALHGVADFVSKAIDRYAKENPGLASDVAARQWAPFILHVDMRPGRTTVKTALLSIGVD